ncbi:hypothetical protein Ciccas_007964 [Cichlidogyrus casuarinus]|uniref:Uncharacterized protein n=1 Tax=Cichlidogyrus casuarinus TaxID=1844966 RepID=A0ABD2Q5F6_9PLAT
MDKSAKDLHRVALVNDCIVRYSPDKKRIHNYIELRQYFDENHPLASKALDDGLLSQCFCFDHTRDFLMPDVAYSKAMHLKQTEQKSQNNPNSPAPTTTTTTNEEQSSDPTPSLTQSSPACRINFRTSKLSKSDNSDKNDSGPEETAEEAPTNETATTPIVKEQAAEKTEEAGKDEEEETPAKRLKVEQDEQGEQDEQEERESKEKAKSDSSPLNVSEQPVAKMSTETQLVASSNRQGPTMMALAQQQQHALALQRHQLAQQQQHQQAAVMALLNNLHGNKTAQVSVTSGVEATNSPLDAITASQQQQQQQASESILWRGGNVKICAF